MKILLVADLHYSLPQWDWLNDTANRFDLVIVAGDLLDIASIVPLEAQIVVVRKYIERLVHEAPLLVSSGNHDILEVNENEPRNASWIQEKQGFNYLADGDDYEHDDLYFSLFPWWESESQRADIEAQLIAQQAKAEGKRWIWVYHSPPKGTTVAWDGRHDFGDEYLPAWIERFKPEMVLGGHIHNAPFYGDGSWIDHIHGAWLFNSGKQTGGIPCFTVIDTDKNKAMWLSAEDGEQAQLIVPLERKPLD
jgi:Icc-related predicted phosphoesterase